MSIRCYYRCRNSHVCLRMPPHLNRRMQGDLWRKTLRGCRLSGSPLVASAPGPVCTSPRRVRETIVLQRNCLLDRCIHVPGLITLRPSLSLARSCRRVFKAADCHDRGLLHSGFSTGRRQVLPQAECVVVVSLVLAYSLCVSVL